MVAVDRITITTNDCNNNFSRISSSDSRPNQGQGGGGGDDDHHNPANSMTTTTTTTTTSADTTTGEDNYDDDNTDVDEEKDGNSVVNDDTIIGTTGNKEGGCNSNTIGGETTTTTTTTMQQHHPPPPDGDGGTTVHDTTSNDITDTNAANDMNNNGNDNHNNNNNNDPASSFCSDTTSASHSLSRLSTNSTSLQSSETQRISELRSILPDASDEQLISILRENDRASQITRQSADDAIFAATTFANEEAEAAAAAVAAVAAAEAAAATAAGVGERLSRTSDSSGGGSVGGGGGSTGMRGSMSSLDSRSRRSWRPCQPPILSYSHNQYHHHLQHHAGGVVVGGGGITGAGLDNGNGTTNATTTTTTSAAAGSTNTINIHGIEYDLGSNTDNNDELEVRRIEIVSQLQEELCSKLGYNLCESGQYEEMEQIYNEWETMLSTTSSASTLLTTTAGAIASAQAVGAGGGTPATNTTDGGSSERREKKKLLPTTVMWDAPPSSRKSLMEREPDLPEVRDPLPLPPVLAGGRDNFNNNNREAVSNLGRGGKRGGRMQDNSNRAYDEICVGTILKDHPATARTQHHNTEYNNEAHKADESSAGCHVNDQHSADNPGPLRPYDLAIRCDKCRVILKVQFDVGLVVCPQCRTINQNNR